MSKPLGAAMLDAMTYEGHRVIQAWLMFRASYAYTRSFDGEDGMSFGRWYSFKHAFTTGISYLWKRS